ncbi:MAG: DUF2231 domain-containing protein [Solirubrobacterales bacterium]
MEAHAEASGPVTAKRAFDPILIGLPVGFAFCLLLLPIHLDRLFGLPAHPLLLHLPVVLIPVLAAAAIAVAVRPRWRERYGLALAVLALVALASTVLAAGAGDALLESRRALGAVDPTLSEHAELGEQLRNIMVVFAGGVVALAMLDAVRRRGNGPSALRLLADLIHHPRLELAARVALALVAAVALVWAVRTGHAGAKATWDQPAGAGEGSPALSGDSQGSNRLP